MHPAPFFDCTSRIKVPGAIAVLVAMLNGCGGGGGTQETAARNVSPPPTSGSYAWLLKAQGSTGALKYGLSLLHPNAPGIEFVVEAGSSFVTDTKAVLRGSVDAGHASVNSLAPYALLYIVGGDVRSVSLQANGATPSDGVQRAQSSSACSFALDAPDYATPQNSRFVVGTAGADGQCRSADDGHAELRFNSDGSLSFTPLTGLAPLGVVRDSATLQPLGWLLPRTLSFWDPTGAAPVTLRANNEAAFTGLIAQTHRDALLDDGTQLSLLDVTNRATPVETRLSATTTGGGGWVAIGFDADDYYLYRNSNTTVNASWTVLKIGRRNPTASILASGTGQISVASLGTNQLYVTILGTSLNTLIAISKTLGVPGKTLESTLSNTLSSVQTSATDVHQLWRVQNIGGPNITYTVEMIDENETRLRSYSGGWPMAVAQADTQNFNTSENRTRFVFATSYGARGFAFADASLLSYDTAARTDTPLGTLPGSSVYGNSFVFASASGGPESFMTGFAARSDSGLLEADSATVFSFDIARASSLTAASSKQ